MKKAIYLFLLIFSTTVVSAQQQSSEPNDIGEILEQANADFKDITGAQQAEENGFIFYTCTHPSVFGQFGGIFKDTSSGKTSFVMALEYVSAVEEFKNALYDYIIEKFPEPEYYIMDDVDEFYEELAVFSADPSDRKQYLMYIVDIDPTTLSEVFSLTIYGASAQKVTED